MSEVLVIAVHPDDETLGCGGSLLKHKKNGDSLNWLIITEMRRELGFSEERISKRNEEISKVKDFYGFNRVIQIGIPTTQVDTFSMGDLVQRLYEHILEIKPEVLYVPYLFDAHSDHKVVYESLTPFFKGFRYPFIKKVLMMETVSETEYAFPVENRMFTPNYYIDISNFIEDKIKAMRIFESEIIEAPFPRSEGVIKALAQYRGSFIACDYAEAFMLIKEVC